MVARIFPAIVAGLLLSFHSVAYADAAADQLKALQDHKALLDAQQGVIASQTSILTAQKAQIDAMYPAFSGGKNGDITSGSSLDTFHANLNAYNALTALAGRFCTWPEVETYPALVLSSDDLAAIATAKILKDQLDGLLADYKDALQTVAPKGERIALIAGAYAAATALTAVADLTRLFRTDQQVSQETVALSDADFANALSACAPRTFLLASSLATAALLTAPTPGSLWGKYEDAAQLRARAQAVQAEDEAELATIDKSKLTNRDDRKTFIALQASADRLKAILAAHANLDLVFLGSNDTTKEPNVLRLLRGEALLNKITTTPKIQILTANVILKGGFSIISKSIWRADRFYSRGGLVVSYRLMTPDGSVVKAGIVSQESLPQEVLFSEKRRDSSRP